LSTLPCQEIAEVASKAVSTRFPELVCFWVLGEKPTDGKYDERTWNYNKFHKFKEFPMSLAPIFSSGKLQFKR